MSCFNSLLTIAKSTRDHLVHAAVPVGCFLPAEGSAEIVERKSETADPSTGGQQKDRYVESEDDTG